MTYDCMTPDELTLWREGSALVRDGGSRPCVDCPLSFRLQEYEAGRCCQPRPVRRRGEVPYEQTPARLAYKREWMRSFRARQRAAA